MATPSPFPKNKSFSNNIKYKKKKSEFAIEWERIMQNAGSTLPFATL